MPSCGRKPESESRLRLAWSADPVSLDPAKAVDVVGGNAVSLLFEGLVVFDAEGNLAPGIASRWETEEEGRIWRFHLDANARDSEGRAFQSEDVAASLRRLLDPKTASPRSWVLESIRGAADFHAGRSESLPGLVTQGHGVIQIELESPTPSFGALLAMPNAAILPQGGATSGLVSTGPWTLVEHVRDSHLLLRRNPHWHGTAPAFEELHIKILPEEITRVAEFETGRLDVLEVPAAESARFRADERYAAGFHRQVLLAVEYIGLNNADPVLRDPRVRRALNHAVNVELILAQVLGGRGVRASGAVPPVLGGGGTAFPYDPDAARRLLQESRVPADWELELWQRPSPVASQVLEAVQADLGKVGVRAVLRVRDWSALKASIDQGETPAFFANWYGDYPDPENFLVPLFHSRNIGGGGNRARFHDAGIDSALDALATLPAGPQRIATCVALDRRIHEAAPWIYLWHPASEIVVATRLEGFRPSRVPIGERWTTVRLASVTP